MPQYAVLAKYSATALTAIRGAGYVTRIHQMKNFCESRAPDTLAEFDAVVGVRQVALVL